jgi:Ca-activated chloride channel family protein
MIELDLFFEAFHFLRPWLLVLVPVVLVTWWRVRRALRPDAPMNDGLAPHLREAMTLGTSTHRRIQPIDGVALALVLTALGAAGPTWSRVPDPFLAQTAPAVIVLKVTHSMDGIDVQPSRLERGKQKIRDLLELRAGARTALVAYSGTAHRVVPLTEDSQIMLPYLEGLSTQIMPQEGANAAAAMQVATDILAAQDAPGGVLFVTDGLDASDVSAVLPTPEISVAFLSMLPEGLGDRGLDAISDAPVVPVTPDDADIRQLDRLLNAAYRRALLDDESQQWNDRGWWLALPAALITLLWFRRGWTMKWGMIVLLTIGTTAPTQSRADGLADWFFTPDQQGRLAYDQKDVARAAELFTDPLWQGYALFKHGDYEKAVEVLGRLDTAEAAYIQGVALIRNRKYRDGVRAFEAVLEIDPEYPNAAENLEVARQIVEFIEETREQSDTGEESGIGADDIVFDNESGRGAETEISVEEEGEPQLLSTEQWMNSVETKAGDFLRLRFLLEANTSP